MAAAKTRAIAVFRSNRGSVRVGFLGGVITLSLLRARGIAAGTKATGGVLYNRC